MLSVCGQSIDSIKYWTEFRGLKSEADEEDS